MYYIYKFININIMFINENIGHSIDSCISFISKINLIGFQYFRYQKLIKNLKIKKNNSYPLLLL